MIDDLHRKLIKVVLYEFVIILVLLASTITFCLFYLSLLLRS
jgi:hypothetical protein